MTYREPIELNGPSAGYNNGPTRRVGQWITNESGLIGDARSMARNVGAQGLAGHLRHILRNPLSVSGGGASRRAADTRYYLSDYDLDEVVDWAQVAYALLISQEDDESKAAVRRLLEDRDKLRYVP